jgi:hypothetical protein
LLPLEQSITPHLKAMSFKKKARSWWRATEDSIQVVNIQKSSFGPQVYINLGIYIRSLGPELTPPEYRCHIRTRLERVVPEELTQAVTSATSEGPPSEDLMRSILTHGTAWLEALSTPVDRKKVLGEPRAAAWAVSQVARGA